LPWDGNRALALFIDVSLGEGYIVRKQGKHASRLCESPGTRTCETRRERRLLMPLYHDDADKSLVVRQSSTPHGRKCMMSGPTALGTDKHDQIVVFGDLSLSQSGGKSTLGNAVAWGRRQRSAGDSGKTTKVVDSFRLSVA
jgi:hypothetical protein